MKVDIIFRACSNETKADRSDFKTARPPWFDKRICYKSVWDMTDKDPARFSIHTIYDGPDSPLTDYISKLRMSHDGLKRGKFGSTESIQLAFNYADTLDGDYLYFVEDDYLHTPDAARVFSEGIKRFGLFTLYDHLDRYCRDDDVTQGMESITMTEYCYWRTCESTTSSFALSRDMWRSVRSVARKHGAGDRSFFKDLFNMGIRLWSPMPGRSTHCHTGTMSPFVDWAQVAKGVML